ncbi:MAG TPA: hypothetical protein VFR03_10455 [Thermoanaerobaculia bacterium]|nr:hypothetical protein [Thermoanaerobaculia bacterium]
MFTERKKIDSGSRWLLAAFILPLCLVAPGPCAAASSADLAARANHRFLPATGVDPTDIFIPIPPPPPPPVMADLAARAGHLLSPARGLEVDPTDIFIPIPPPPPPPAGA